MEYKYWCVIDFEATCWDNKKSVNEIIEFPSVLFKLNDNNELEYLSEFRKYCKPIVNPKLSNFCVKLTGIKQSEIDQATIFPIVYKQHYEWLLSNIGDEKMLEQLIFISCGDWDLKIALPNELKKWYTNKDLIKDNYEIYKFICKMPTIYKRFINIKNIFYDVYKIKGGMVRMLKHMNLELEGRHHSGLDDCKNIGKILKTLIFNGYNLKQINVIKLNYVLSK
jgi:inhibitor of KinA sporulation pathway (predicted exonuclease)